MVLNDFNSKDVTQSIVQKAENEELRPYLTPKNIFLSLCNAWATVITSLSNGILNLFIIDKDWRNLWAMKTKDDLPK